ncbi:MAG: glycosyltransferase family 39 protein [Stagnimonas sp.]|nr:glycosyltransferase family 39 protein [Stagnimonas sp.]
MPRQHWLLFGLALFCGYWLNSWAVPLFDLDEGAFSEATREMFARGDFLMTYLDGEPRYDKPILVYWLQAASVALLGWNEFALRLPSMLAASLWAWAVYRFTLEISGSRDKALFAGGSLALSLIPGLIGHAATADALLNLLLALSLLDLWRWFSTPSKGLLLRVYLWIGLGMLTKGPVAVALPLMVTVPFVLLHGRWRDGLKAAFFIPGWLLALAVFLPWAVALSLRDGGEFFRHFLLDHNVSRYTDTMESHGGQLWYYAAFLPLIVLPFSAWLVPALASARRWKTEPLTSYLLIWFGGVFILFSTSATQLPHYLLYGCTPLFVLFGLHHEAITRRWLALLPAALFLFLLLALPSLLPLFPPPAHRLYERGLVDLITASVGPGYYLACGGGLLLLALTALRPQLPAWQATLRAGIAVAIAAWGGVLPLLATGQQWPVKLAGLKAKELALPTVAHAIHMPSFSVYREAATPHRTPVAGELAFTRVDRLESLQKEVARPLVIEYQAGGIVLVRVD